MRLDFGHALRDFLSRNQTAREYAAKKLLEEAKEPGAVAGVIAHHPELGFRPSVMATLAIHPRYAEEAARYLGAWHGLLVQDPSIVAFTVGDGPDRLHHVTAPLPPQELAQHLRDAGVLRFAIRPGDRVSTAHVYDKGGVYDFTPLAEKLGGNVNYSSGSGRRLSEGAGPATGGAPHVAAYRAHIRRAESAAAEPAETETDRLRLARITWSDGGTRGGAVKGDFVTSSGEPYEIHFFPRQAPHKGVHIFSFNDRHGSYDITNAGNAREVLRTVVEGLHHHLREHKPQVVYFSSGEPSRQKLYSYLLKRLGRHAKDYVPFETQYPTQRHHFLVHKDQVEEWRQRAVASMGKLKEIKPDETPGRLARLARGPAARELKPWATALELHPDRAGPFSDWLEDHGHHHDERTLQFLRSSPESVAVARHPKSGKVVAWDNSGRAEVALRARTGGLIISGPGGHAVVTPAGGSNNGSVLDFYDPSGTSYVVPTVPHVYYHPEHQAAVQIARRHAFGD